MRYLILLLLVTSVFCNHSSGQSLKFGLHTGFGFYSMPNLGEINNSVSEDLPFDTKIVADFPPYWNYNTSLLLGFKNFNIGINYSFQSTGSRVSAKDYSGDYHFDMKVKANSAGIYGDIVYSPYKKIEISFYSKLNIAFSNLEIAECLMISDSSLMNSTYEFKSVNYYFEPGLNFAYSITKYLDIGMYAGYLIGFGSQAFYSVKDKDYKLYNPNNYNTIKPEWNGFRIGLSIYYTFIKKEFKQ